MYEISLLSLVMTVVLGVLLGSGCVYWLYARRRFLAPSKAPDVVLLAESGIIFDQTPAAREIIGLESDTPPNWHDLRVAFFARFPGIPESFTAAMNAAPLFLRSCLDQDDAQLSIVPNGSRLRITMTEGSAGASLVRHHRAIQELATLKSMSKAMQDAPYPVWVQDKFGRDVWRSPEYVRLRESFIQDSNDRDKPLFQIDPIDFANHHSLRFNLPGTSADSAESWYEISMSESEGTRTFFAVNITALVQAEVANRNFVQTLTKTFAHLGTGLAIFDRERSLVLFNPALIELTKMTGEFLSARPTLMTFFDYLREARIMPEPRNYTDWRQQLSDLTKAAADGTFSELWSLPNGLSYRVHGRPHPDGAIAFLFEDVTAELSLTRNFINELEINHALLDSLADAIAVISSSGELISVNRAYRIIWNCGPDEQLLSKSVALVIDEWKAGCQPSNDWESIAHALTNPDGAIQKSGEVCSINHGRLQYKVTPLVKGACAIRFRQTNLADLSSNMDRELV